MQALNVLGDKNKYFIELSHQDGTRQSRCTQGLGDYTQNHKYQHKAEHRASHPTVQEAKVKIRAKVKLLAKIYATKERIEEKERRHLFALKKK